MFIVQFKKIAAAIVLTCLTGTTGIAAAHARPAALPAAALDRGGTKADEAAPSVAATQPEAGKNAEPKLSSLQKVDALKHAMEDLRRRLNAARNDRHPQPEVDQALADAKKQFETLDKAGAITTASERDSLQRDLADLHKHALWAGALTHQSWLQSIADGTIDAAQLDITVTETTWNRLTTYELKNGKVTATEKLKIMPNPSVLGEAALSVDQLTAIARLAAGCRLVTNASGAAEHLPDAPMMAAPGGGAFRVIVNRPNAPALESVTYAYDDVKTERPDMDKLMQAIISAVEKK